MANKKDYYDVLGVSKNSSQEEIKSAYRKLAREHHPDMVKNGNKEAAEKRFKEINEAYQVLSDNEKKKMYDQFGHAGVGANGYSNAQNSQGFGNQYAGGRGPFTYTYSTNGQQADFDPFEIFEEFFGFRGFGGQRAPKRGKNLYYELTVDFVDVVKGAEKKVKVNGHDMKIKIPKGARNGTELKFREKGEKGPQGTPNGDLLITLRVPTPQQFQRVGDDLVTAKEINIVQATLGDSIKIPVVDEDSKDGLGTAKLKIPAGTQPGTQFRIKNKGMPKLHGYGQGSVYVKVFVTIPKKVSNKQKKILEELGKELS